MKNPDQLITDYLDDELSTSDEAVLNAWLKADGQNMRRFADAVLFDQQVRTAAYARQAQPASKPPFQRRHWLGRVAAGIGAVPFLNQMAAASVLNQSAFLLMKKAITSATAAILLAGGCGLYVLHQRNEASRVRTAQMETEAQTLSTQLGLKSERLASSANPSRARSRGAAELIVILNKKQASMADAKLWQEVHGEIAAMDAESLKNLLLDAEKLRNPVDDALASSVMKVIIEKDPAAAIKLAAQLIARGSQFQFRMSDSAARAFKAWLAKDPAAADAWYMATAAAHGFDSNAIPQNGLEYLEISRSLARLRFAAQVIANPAEAEAMLAGMVEEDVTLAMQEIKDPAAVARLLPKLPAQAKVKAAEGAIKSMAASDLSAAFTWANTLGMGTRERDTLLATGIESAVAGGKLDLAGVKQFSQQLDLAADRRSQMQGDAAVSSTLVPGEKGPVAAWDRVPGHCDWLRAEAPPELASKTVGTYLGRLAYRYGLDAGLKAFEQEAAKQPAPDSALTIAFASSISIHHTDQAKAAALKLLQKLPTSPERDNAVEIIELNR